MPRAKWGRPRRGDGDNGGAGSEATSDLSTPVVPSKRPRFPVKMVLAATAGFLIAAAEAYLGYITATLDDGEWASALVIVPIAFVILILTLAVLILWLWEPRAATVFTLTLIGFSVLAVWWTSMYGLSLQMELDGGATTQARSLLATTSGTKCVLVRDGAVGPLPAPYSRCVYSRTDLRQVVYEVFQATDGLIYQPGVSTPNAQSLCVRHLSGEWWAFTQGSFTYGHLGPACPSGYQAILGG